MCAGFKNWVAVFCFTQFGRALTWNQEEQFVEGDFPYYPFNTRVSFLREGLTDPRAIVSEFSGSRNSEVAKALRTTVHYSKPYKKRFVGDDRHPAAFYEFRNTCSPVNNVTTPGNNRGQKAKPLEIKKLCNFWRRPTKTAPKKKQEEVEYDMDGIHLPSKEKRENLKVVGIHSGQSRTNSSVLSKIHLNDVRSNTLATLGDLHESTGLENLEAQEIVRHTGIDQNMVQPHVRMGNGTSSLIGWSARDSKKFKRRDNGPNRQRWLDFMKNTVEKSPGRMIVTDTGKQLFAQHSGKCGWCNKNRMPWRRKPKGTLIANIDTLLSDMSRFQAKVRQETINRQLQPSKDDPRVMMRRLARSAPPSADGKYFETLETDLQALKNNIILYKNNVLNEPNRQAINDMKLHIKVYVEKNGENNNEEK